MLKTDGVATNLALYDSNGDPIGAGGSYPSITDDGQNCIISPRLSYDFPSVGSAWHFGEPPSNPGGTGFYIEGDTLLRLGFGNSDIFGNGPWSISSLPWQSQPVLTLSGGGLIAQVQPDLLSLWSNGVAVARFDNDGSLYAPAVNVGSAEAVRLGPTWGGYNGISGTLSGNHTRSISFWQGHIFHRGIGHWFYDDFGNEWMRIDESGVRIPEGALHVGPNSLVINSNSIHNTDGELVLDDNVAVQSGSLTQPTLQATSMDHNAIMAVSTNGQAAKFIQKNWTAPHDDVPVVRIYSGTGSGHPTSPLIRTFDADPDTLRPILESSIAGATDVFRLGPRGNPDCKGRDWQEGSYIVPDWDVPFHYSASYIGGSSSEIILRPTLNNENYHLPSSGRVKRITIVCKAVVGNQSVYLSPEGVTVHTLGGTTFWFLNPGEMLVLECTAYGTYDTVNVVINASTLAQLTL